MLSAGLVKYNTSPDGTKHVRKFIITQDCYDFNNGYGDVARIRNKGITVEVASS